MCVCVCDDIRSFMGHKTGLSRFIVHVIWKRWPQHETVVLLFTLWPLARPDCFFSGLSLCSALGTLGFGDYKEEAKAVLQEAKAVAAKKRRGSTRLENLGIPEEELLRQQQELFEKARLRKIQIPSNSL